jgi:hypothetical protein
MALFTERRIAQNPAMIPPSGDRRRASRDAHRDPISGAPRARPLGTGLGAAAGGIATGAAAGKSLAELIDPTAEESYWRSNYMREPYYERGYNFEDYYPGYRTGWEGRRRYENRGFDEVERELARDYQRNRGASRLEWAKNRHAARAAWERFDGPDFFERSQ